MSQSLKKSFFKITQENDSIWWGHFSIDCSSQKTTPEPFSASLIINDVSPLEEYRVFVSPFVRLEYEVFLSKEFPPPDNLNKIQ